MNRRWVTVLAAIAVAGAAMFLSCDLFTNTSSVSFWAASLTLGDGDRITGVSVEASNAGKEITNAAYEVLLTLNDLDAYDAVLYRGTATIPSGESTIQVSWDNQIRPYLSSHSTVIKADSYRIGFQYDPEGSTSNGRPFGQALCPRELWVINDSPCPFVASGTISYGTYSAIPQYFDGSTWGPLPGGTYDLYVGFMSTEMTKNGITGSITPASLLYPGWQRTDFSYDSTSSSTTVSFRCGVPAAGSYVLVAFVDANRNGLLDADSTGVLEPIGSFNDYSSGTPTVVYINDDLSGLTIDWLGST